MTRPRPNQPSRSFPGQTRLLRRIHRYAGVAAGGVLVYLLVTGLPLQFDSLQLGDQFVSTPFILESYNLDAPAEVSFDSGIAQVGNRLFWEDEQIVEAGELLGAVNYQGLVVIGTPDALFVLSPTAPGALERIDQLTPLAGIALHQGQVLLNTGSGIHQMDSALLNALPVPEPPGDIEWQSPQLISGSQSEIYRSAYRQRLLSVERLLQDLHSGRAFGPIGVWVINLGTLLLAGLAITGYWIWWRSR